MKHFLCLFLSSILLLSLSSCKGDDPAPVSSKAEKTIFVYMPWTASENSTNGNLYSYFSQNISDIESAIKQQGGLGSNRVLVFISKSSTYSALLEIKYSKNQCTRDTLKRYNNYEYTTPSGIAGILNDVKTNAEASQYDMIIGCHGSGWIPKGLEDYYRTRSFGGSSAKYQTEISDLASGISLAGMHMQFISFDDCYMAGVEVAYDLRNVADYLIASTSEIMADGMPYTKVWQYMTPATPDYNGICQAFLNYYSSATYPYGTLSVINCNKIADMANVMKSINSQYTFDTSKLESVQKLDGLGQTTFFDLGSYVENLCGQKPATFTSSLSLLVPYCVHTSEIYTAFVNYNGGFSTVPINTFSGITISDPTENTYLVNYVSQTNWWKATH
jgi:hypothetical protein